MPFMGEKTILSFHFPLHCMGIYAGTAGILYVYEKERNDMAL